MTYSPRQRLHAAIRHNPPDGWGHLFAPVPGRSGRTRCLLCGATGYGHHGRIWPGFDGHLVTPAPWQVPHIAGHPARCTTCRRPFVSTVAVAAHQSCTLHHACCGDHTTVPTWKNPFTPPTARP